MLTTALIKSRERWLRNTAFTELRNQMDALLRGQGQVMSAHEVALALLSLRGCAEQDDAERLRQASAVVRAAIEAESHLDQPRFEAFDNGSVTLIATSAACADYARQLGAAADACAMADPLLPPGRVLETLEGILPPATLGAAATPSTPLLPTRLLRLAASASRKAALSSRQEIYPRGMSALQALKASINALVGATLSPQALQARVRGRYPESAALPGRPALDRLLDEAGAPLHWDATAADGNGAYRSATLGSVATAGTTTQFSRQGTMLSPGARTEGSALEATAAEVRLQRGWRQGGLLVLTVEPRLARRAEAELLHRFGEHQAPGRALQRLSVDALLLAELRTQAAAARVDWNVVLRADAADKSTRDWTNLMRLVQRALPPLRAALLQSATPVLMVSAGLLARYDLMALVTEIEEAAGRPGQTPAVWLLLPSAHQGLPVIDGAAVPLVNNLHNTQTLALPQAWIENQHRAGLAA